MNTTAQSDPLQSQAYLQIMTVVCSSIGIIFSVLIAYLQKKLGTRVRTAHEQHRDALQEHHDKIRDHIVLHSPFGSVEEKIQRREQYKLPARRYSG